MQQVKELQDKVRLLESRQAQPVPEPANSSSVENAEITSEPAAKVEPLHDLHGIQWRGFGEVDYKVLDQRQPETSIFGFTPGSAGNFFIGDFDLYLTSKIGQRTSVLAEIVIGEQEHQTFDVDLERMLLKYDYNDHLRMSFGRYHTGISYYNTAFHSGRWLQTAVDRPLIIEFAAEGGLLPTQGVGVSMTGLIPSGPLGLNYQFEYGSGDTIRPDIDGSGKEDDEENGNHVLLGLFARPLEIPGLQVGGSFYHDKISNHEAGENVRFGQTILNAHVIYVAHGIESLNEGFLVRHAPENSSTVFNTPAFYSQLSKSFGHIRPYFRYQYVNASAEGFYEDVLLRHGPSFGARYDLSDNVAFKVQLDHTLRKTKPDLNGLQMQLAFTF